MSLRLLAILLAVMAAIYIVRAADSRHMPDPGAEHRIRFASEFSAVRERDTEWSDYLEIESALSAELDFAIHRNERTESLLDRYSTGSLVNPGRFDGNWNRSYEISTAVPRGVAVLLHGLSDSPYSMLSTAEALAGAGYNVVVPRMPGHGFAVGGLQQVRWEDWTAAIRVAVRHAVQLPAGERSLVIGGYSNGGLLALDYALTCNKLETPCPDKLILISPAIAVPSIAAIANWHVALTWLPYFEKFGWFSILPEIDPFKFTSFPKRAAAEIHRIARRVNRMLADPARVSVLPPVLAFQSVVDNTVSSAAVYDRLYRKLPTNGSKLVVYDINRNNTAIHVMRNLPGDPLDFFCGAVPLNFDLAVLRNRSSHGLGVDAATVAAGQVLIEQSPIDAAWPPDVYSLSHIALPFRSDDRVYGNVTHSTARDASVVFGALAPRGEVGMLLLTPEYFLRARSNPFFRYQTETMVQWLASE